VSRTFLYTNPDAKTAVAEAIRERGDQRGRLLAEADGSGEATWRERALNAEDALKTAHAEILAQRSRIGELLGRIRDLEAEWAQAATSSSSSVICLRRLLLSHSRSAACCLIAAWMCSRTPSA
jgi:hypothetical protein